MAAKLQSNEIHIIRFYDAPLQVVWDAWTEPEQTAQWWGPRGFTLTTHSKDLRVGGIWHYTMHGPDGTDYPNKTLYLEVEKHRKLVYDHGGNDERAPLFRVEVLFAEKSGKTKMDMRMILSSPEAAAETKKFIKQAGGNATWDRLAEYLEKESSGAEKFVINRTFDAPLDLMFELWTKPEHISKWLPPTGFQMEFIRADIKPGGGSLYFMSNGADVKMYGRAKYLDIHKPDTIIYTQEFCDEHERLARHPLAPTWPATMLTTVNLRAESPTQTLVTVTWEVTGAVTKEELETFINGRAGMTQGWGGSFDKLEEYLTQWGKLAV